MKTKFKSFGLFGILFALMTFFSGAAKAQCPEMIQNTLTCPVDVTVAIYMPDADGTCTQLCNSYAANLGPGMIMPVNCAGCQNVCDIVVTVVAVNGMPVPPTSADFSTNVFPGNFIGPGNPPCAPAGSSMYIYYDPATMTFIIHF